MNINMTPKTPHARLFQRSAADWHPLLSPVFLCSPAKEALMGMWRPVSGVLAKFTSHLESPEPGELRHCLPLWNPPTPPSWSRSAMREPLSHQHLRNKSDTLLTAAYSEAGGWGITWKEWYSWQIFSLKGKKIRFGGGVIFFFFLKGKTVCSLNTLRLNEKFPQVLNIWKVSMLAVDKRQSWLHQGAMQMTHWEASLCLSDAQRASQTITAPLLSLCLNVTPAQPSSLP